MDKYNAAGRIKKVIDIILGLLFIVLLGYSFTGAPLDEVIGQMIQDTVGGDIVSVNTKEHYPASYSDTVSVASKEMSRRELPELVDMPENIEEYDMVFLVFPLWLAYHNLIQCTQA